VKRTPDGWDWTGGVATSSIGSQTVNFGTLEMMVSPDPEYLDMNANSGQITFSSDCSEIIDAGLFVRLDGSPLLSDPIGFFSVGVCEVDVDLLQNIAKQEDMLQIDFSVRHLGIEWPMSKFSMDVDWGDDPIRANAKLTTRDGREVVGLEIRTVVPGIFTHQDYLRLRVTLLDSDRKQIGEEYEDEGFWLANTRKMFPEIKDGFNCHSPQSVCGVRINISERDSGNVLFDKTKLVKMEKKRASTVLIHGNIWAGEAEVDFPHQELQETGDDGYEWSDRPKIMPRDIRSRWENELQPMDLDYDHSRIIIGCFGHYYEVVVPLITDVDYGVLEQSEMSCELWLISHGDCKVRDTELIFDPVNNEIAARFLLESNPIDSREISLTVRPHSIGEQTRTILLDLGLEPLIKMIEKPYVDDGVLYFAEGKISGDGVKLTRHRFSSEGETIEVGQMESGVIGGIIVWCPECGSQTDQRFSPPRCHTGGCSQNPDNQSSDSPVGFDYRHPEDIVIRPVVNYFHYGILTDRLDDNAWEEHPKHSKEDEKMRLNSLDYLHSISEKVTVLRGHCNGI
jgi:hypothetical protein